MSCLFNSLSYFTHEAPHAIRGRICDYLAGDPALVDDMSASLVIALENGQGLEQYVGGMRSPSTWGGAIEIRAFVQLWRRPVRVWVIRTGRWIEFPCSCPAEGAGEECKISWTGGHYEPMH
jgi:hypothetical protein